jgi:hypothetical protein
MVAAVGNQLRYDLDGLLRVLDEGGPNMADDAIAYAKLIGKSSFSQKIVRNDFPFILFLEQNAKRQIQAAEEYASKISNPIRKQEIAAAIAELQAQSSQIGDAVRAVLAK